MKYLIPFEYIKPNKIRRIYLIWLSIILGFWLFNSFVGDIHKFPKITDVYYGYVNMVENFDLLHHIFRTLSLSFQSIVISIFCSLLIVYSSPLGLLKPLSTFISQMRYLPFAGITYYLSILISDGRALQTTILVIFTTTFLVTSLMGYIKDIPEEEFDNAKTLGLNRWEILWYVVVVGRMDYVFESIRQNLAIVTMSIVTVETILASEGGIGFLIKTQTRLGNHENMVALQLLILVITFLIDLSITKIRKYLFTYSTF